MKKLSITQKFKNKILLLQNFDLQKIISKKLKVCNLNDYLKIQ